MMEGRDRGGRLLRGKGSRERRCGSQTQAQDRLGRRRSFSKYGRIKDQGRDRATAYITCTQLFGSR